MDGGASGTPAPPLSFTSGLKSQRRRAHVPLQRLVRGVPPPFAGGHGEILV